MTECNQLAFEFQALVEEKLGPILAAEMSVATEACCCCAKWIALVQSQTPPERQAQINIAKLPNSFHSQGAQIHLRPLRRRT